MPFCKKWTAEQEIFICENYLLSDNKIAKLMSNIFKKEFTHRMIQSKRQRIKSGEFKKSAGRKKEK